MEFKMAKTTKKRDYNIKKSYEGEINLNTKVVKSKKAYSRKSKYKDDYR